MSNEKKFNLYEDEPDNRQTSNNPEQTSGNLVSDSVIIYLDLTKPLPELIKPIREELQSRPDGFELNLYLVCGLNCNPDLELFIDYLKTVQMNFKLNFYIRGIIHPSFIHVLFEENVFVESNLKLIYRQDSLHQLLKNLMKKPDLFRKFVQRFIDSYSIFPSETFLDTTELETIGFKLEKF